jgi:site-specific recombinase XerD
MELKPLSIRFYLKKKWGHSERCTLYIRLVMSGKRTDISLNYDLDRADWEESSQSLKAKHPDRGYLLNLTNQYRQNALNVFQNLIQRGMDCDVNIIRENLTGKQDANNPYHQTLFKTFNRVIERKKALAGKNNTKGTIQKYCRAKSHLSSYLKQFYKADDIKFDKIDLRFVEDFELYLKTSGNCCHNTTMKHIQTVKSVFKTAQAHGYTSKDPFQKFKIRMEEVVRCYLNENEIAKLINEPIENPKLSSVRDMFIFSCYTGLAYIDLKNLKVRNIQKEDGEKYWIRTVRQKTNVKTNVPLLDVPLDLIRQYRNDFEEGEPDSPIFRIISNQKMNSYLKDLAKLCNIPKELTFHIARHTFATSITLNNGVPIESVSSMLGHTNIKTTQHYAKILDKKLEVDMDRLRSILNAR